MTLSRRSFIRTTLGTGAAMLIGCADRDADVVPGGEGELVGIVPFVDRHGAPRLPDGELIDEGLDARRYIDLESLTADTLITPADRFFVRTAAPLNLDGDKPWSIRIGGLVEQPVDVPLADLLAHERPLGVHLLECSGNHPSVFFRLISAGDWHGVPIQRLLDRAQPTSGATRVRFGGLDEHSRPISNSTPGASWIFTLDQLDQAGAFLASRLNGQPLPRDNGHPVRLIVPGWFACCDTKWLNEAEYVDDDQPATPHMIEYARRTGQSDEHPLARDYRPALIDAAALPIRIEQRSAAGRTTYRVVGIQWGGDRATESLTIRCRKQDPFVPVRYITPAADSSWRLWVWDWTVPLPGTYAIKLRFTDTTLNTRRMDGGYSDRIVQIDAV